jgi:hypothetical protein
MGAIQLMPTLEFSQNSTRQSGLSEENANFLSFRLQDLRTLVTPFYDFTSEPRSLSRLGQIGWPFDERYSYVGIVPLILALSSFGFLFKNKKVLTHAILGSFFLLLSLGNQTPLGILLRIPPLNMFRLPAKFTVFFQFALAIMATYATVKLLEIVTKKSREGTAKNNLNRAILCVLLVLTLLDTAPKLYKLYPVQKGEWWYSKPILVKKYEQETESKDTDKYYNNRVIGQDYNVQLQKQYLEQDPKLWNELQMQTFKNNREILPAFDMLLYDVPLLTNAINSAGLKVKWYSDFENILFFAPHKQKIDNQVQYDQQYWKIANLAGAKYIIHDQTLVDPNVQLLAQTEFTTAQDQIGLYKINNQLPFIQIPEKLIYTDERTSQSAILSPDFDPTTTISLPVTAPQIQQPAAPNIQVQSHVISATHLQIKT